MDSVVSYSFGAGPRHANILDLSDEVLLQIILYLSQEDRISLSETCSKFQDIMRDPSLNRKLLLRWNSRIGIKRLLKFLTDRVRAVTIKSLDLTDVYWVPSGVVKQVAMKLVNMQELLVAGGNLSWHHLSQLMLHNNNLKRLSWTYDPSYYSPAEENKNQQKLSQDSNGFEKLTHFCVHLAHVGHFSNVSTRTFSPSSYSSLGHLVSTCHNLQTLYVISWPKTTEEIQQSISLSLAQEVFHRNTIDLPYLKSLIIHVEKPARVYFPIFIKLLLQNFKTYSIAPSCIWISHPGLHLRPSNTNGILSLWNSIDKSQARAAAFPTVNLGLESPSATKTEFVNCEHIQLNPESPSRITENQELTIAPKIKTFRLEGHSFSINWRHFAATHPGLESLDAISNNLPEFYMGLSSLVNLKRICVPTDALSGVINTRKAKETKLFGALPSNSNVTDFQKTSRLNDSILNPTNFRKNDAGHEKCHALYRPFKSKRAGLMIESTEVSETENGNRKQMECGLDLFTANCHFVEEFLIISPETSMHLTAGPLMIESLGQISKWKALRHLTLQGLPEITMKGNFLAKIAQSCQLETLKLLNLGNRAQCSYMHSLRTALRYCRFLKDFKLIQNSIGETWGLLEALKCCKSLERCMIWSESNGTHFLDPEAVKNMFECCKELTFFSALLGFTPQSHLKKLQSYLFEKYKLERPGLSVVLVRAQENYNLRSIHYRQMVLNENRLRAFRSFPTFDVPFFK